MIIQKPPSRKGTSLMARFRGDSPFVVIVVVFLLTIGGTLYILERFYTEEKAEIIRAKVTPGLYLGVDTVELQLKIAEYVNVVMGHLKANNPAEEAQLRMIAKRDGPAMHDDIQARLTDLLDKSPVVVSTKLTTLDHQVLISLERPEKLRIQNVMSNSLFDREFERTGSQPIPMRTPKGIERPVMWTISYTTALHDPDIEALTVRYWRYVFLTIAFITIIFYSLFKFTLKPLRSVVLYMEHTESGQAAIIPNPGSPLERAYNLLARDAALTRLSKELRARIATQGISHAEPVLTQLPQLAMDILSIPTIQIWTFHRKTGSEPWQAERLFARKLTWFDEADFREKILREMALADPLMKPEFWRGRILQYVAPGTSGRPYYCDILDTRTDHLWLLVVQAEPGSPPPTIWWTDFFNRMAQEIRYALGSVEDQRRLILQEKSKANISLSRNLGHDLTNIIATSKLELMTVRAILSQGPQTLQSNPTKAKIFEECLQALLNNTRFLQEIVNLYRSFSYLQKPKFEEVAVAALIREVAELYRLTLSKSFQIVLKLDAPLPTARVEPRLLRLALFNLLTNAVDAIKRAGTEEKAEGVITVTGGWDEKTRTISILVEDTGPGIRDASGKLLEADSISEVFRLGYTTKANQEGEGLGLNWVQSIVREFHGGEVSAYNRDQGGAAFLIRIPLESTASERSSDTHNPHPKG